MKTYKIQVKLTITTKEGYNETTVAESDITQGITCYAKDVRATATNIIRQAVDNMSTSAQSGLKELITKEPIEVEDAKEEKALEI